MIDNPYAPPQATHGTVTGDARLSPPLWNPTVATFWCLLFGVMFGSWIHMKNWQVMGKPDKAAASSVLGKTNFFLSLALLLSWYFFSAREQIRFVAATYGNDYQRRGWGTPVAWGVLVIFGAGVAGSMMAIMMAHTHGAS